MPSKAPTQLSVAFPLAWKVARRNTTVSNPSRNTARNAMRTNALDVPLARADCACCSRSCFSSRECRRIQSTMYVTITTAMRPTIVSSLSCCRWGRFVRDDLERHSDSDTDDDGDADTDPDLTERLTTALLAEERGHDAHNEGGLHAFSESDDERR